MPLIHCVGHEFDEHLVDEVPYLWVCANCGLKVKTKEAADYFTGKTS